MRLAKITQLLLLLSLQAFLGTCLAAQEHPNVVPSRVRDQLNQAPAAQPAPQSGNKATAPATKPAAPALKVTAAPSAKTVPTPAKGIVAGKRPVEAPIQKPAAINRRDPFDALLTNAKPDNGIPDNLPPGKAGLMVSTLQIDGIVRGKGGMIVIVSNPQKRVYFLREGDKLYDGSVEHVTLDEVAFHEVAKDAFGKPIERQVTKRLYPSPGEQR